MANVDAERNAAPSEQTVEAESSESITLSEENLEALLNGVRGAAPAPKPTAAQSPAPLSTVSSSPRPSAEIQPAKAEEPLASLALLQGAPAVEAIAPPPFEVSPGAITPLQAAPQPDVNSKLALISAIKQRRAVSPRPEPVSEAEASASTMLPADHADENIAVTERKAPVQPAQQGAAAKSPVEAPSSPRPTPVANVSVSPAAKLPAEVQPQMPLPAKKVWTNAPAAAPAESEPRRSESTETSRPAAVKKPAPKPTVAVAPVEADHTSENNELFAAFAGAAPQEAKGGNFITSKAGMGVIGGAIAAAALIVYFLTAHSAKKEVATPSAPAAAPADIATVSPAPSPNEAKSVTPPSSNPVVQRTPVTPSIPAAPASKPVTSTSGSAQQISQQSAIAQASSQQSAVPETPRTVARAFTAPATARPANPVVDAAPSVAINSTAPAAVSLPARIAPLPPPPAAPAPAAANAPPKQLNVAGAVQAGKLTHEVVPVYPAVAKAARVQGTVHFRAVIGADGAVKSLTTLGGPLPLAQAAADAVRQWRYRPTLVDGKPVEVTTQIDVAFTL